MCAVSWILSLWKMVSRRKVYVFTYLYLTVCYYVYCAVDAYYYLYYPEGEELPGVRNLPK